VAGTQLSNEVTVDKTRDACQPVDIGCAQTTMEADMKVVLAYSEGLAALQLPSLNFALCNMKTIFAALAVGFMLSASSHGARLLHPLEPIDYLSIACGCTFNAVAADGGSGFYSGPELLVLDPNGEPPNARINIGEGNIRLQPAQPIVFPLYECEAGETWTSEWLSETVAVKAELRALMPGEESCWFEGTVRATTSEVAESVAVNGACGC
jgi:hypothetical protein